jgi:hypothetical protein
VDQAVASRVDHSHFWKILNGLRLHARGEVVAWTVDWMWAGIHVGLHPDEWRLTNIEERSDPAGGTKFLLHVFNERVFDTKVAGSFRTIDLSELSGDTRGAVERLVRRTREWTLKGSFALRKSEVSKLLTETAHAAIPRMTLNYTLASLRHQFIDNMKEIYPHENISALIGEMFIDDQAPNYRNQRRAWHSDHIEVPVPLEANVSRFRRSLAIFLERRPLRALQEQYRNARE